jgi:hypothetical protein
MELRLAQADLPVQLDQVVLGPGPVDATPLERHVGDLLGRLARRLFDRLRLGQAAQEAGEGDGHDDAHHERPVVDDVGHPQRVGPDDHHDHPGEDARRLEQRLEALPEVLHRAVRVAAERDTRTAREQHDPARQGRDEGGEQRQEDEQ